MNEFKKGDQADINNSVRLAHTALHNNTTDGKMKKIILLNLIWIMVGFSWWLLMDVLYVKNEGNMQIYDILGTSILLAWPLVSIYPIFNETKKDKNSRHRDGATFWGILISSVIFQYIGIFIAIVTLGISFHFGIGGQL